MKFYAKAVKREAVHRHLIGKETRKAVQERYGISSSMMAQWVARFRSEVMAAANTATPDSAPQTRPVRRRTRFWPTPVKLDAVRRALSGKEKPFAICRDLDIASALLDYWIKQFKAQILAEKKGNGTVDDIVPGTDDPTDMLPARLERRRSVPPLAQDAVLYLNQSLEAHDAGHHKKARALSVLALCALNGDQ